jgi:hypothetical protein
LNAWLKVLPVERLLVLIFEEDIIKSPTATIRKTTDFLGLDSKFESPLKPKAKNPSWTWTRLIFNYYLGPMLRQLEKTPIRHITQNWDPLKSFDERPEDIEFLQETYKDEKKNVEQLTGRDLSCWRYL